MLFDEAVVAPAKILANDLRALVGLAIVALFFAMGTIGIAVVPVPYASDGPLLVGAFESTKFLLGTDIVGKGIFAQLVHATPAMLKMIISGGLFATGMATIWGTVAGYKGGTIDRMMMTISDIVMTIPGLPLVVVLAAFFQPSDPFVVGLLLAVNSWAGFSRALRSQVLTIRQESYVEASRTMGVGTGVIVFWDILPNLMPLIAVRAANSARSVIFRSVGLYFIGVLPFSTFNWGVMMNQAYKSGALFDMRLAHWFVAPMVTIVLFSLGLILLSQGLDRIFNPRIRAKHTKHTGNDDETDITATGEDT
jgi:peptide/nickel transport system permease protein